MRPTYDDNCAAPTDSASCASTAPRGSCDAILTASSEVTPLTDAVQETRSPAFTFVAASDFDLPPSGSLLTDGFAVTWQPHASGGFWAWAQTDAGPCDGAGWTARAAIDACLRDCRIARALRFARVGGVDTTFGAVRVGGNRAEDEKSDGGGEHGDTAKMTTNEQKGQF